MYVQGWVVILLLGFIRNCKGGFVRINLGRCRDASSNFYDFKTQSGASTVSQCSNLCNGYGRACVGIEIQYDPFICRTLFENGQGDPDDSSEAGINEVTSADGTNTIDCFRHFPGEYVGAGECQDESSKRFDYAELRGSNFKSLNCGEKCQAKTDCVGYQHTSDGTRCYLYFSNGSSELNAYDTFYNTFTGTGEIVQVSPNSDSCYSMGERSGYLIGRGRCDDENGKAFEIAEKRDISYTAYTCMLKCQDTNHCVGAFIISSKCYMQFPDGTDLTGYDTAYVSGQGTGEIAGTDGVSSFHCYGLAELGVLATSGPTSSPTGEPTVGPTVSPTLSPSFSPSSSPTAMPTKSPTIRGPTSSPTSEPTVRPTVSPTRSPSFVPTFGPTTRPTESPTTARPTESPTSLRPTRSPTSRPSAVPTINCAAFNANEGTCTSEDGCLWYDIFAGLCVEKGFTKLGNGSCRYNQKSSGKYYTVLTNSGHIDHCFRKCRDTDWCKGVEYKNPRCELWKITPNGRSSSRSRTCWVRDVFTPITPP